MLRLLVESHNYKTAAAELDAKNEPTTNDRQMTKEIDAMGLLINELEDGVVILQVKLDEHGDSDTPRGSAASS